MQELENIAQESQNRITELSGQGGTALPWQQGPRQLSAPTISSDFEKLLQKSGGGQQQQEEQ